MFEGRVGSPGCLERRRLLRSEHTNLLLLLCVDVDGTDVLKMPLLAVEPKQKLIPSAADRIVCWTTLMCSLLSLPPKRDAPPQVIERRQI
jgi:hypothetical protein